MLICIFLCKSFINGAKYKRMLEIDKNASNIYTLGYSNDSWSNLDYTKKMVN